MTCVEVRDHLPEFTLGSLGEAARTQVERHLEWCAGCRKESAELHEGLASVALSLPPVDPPAALEDHVVSAVRSAAGWKAPRSVGRRGVRVLAVAALAAALVAVGATGWGFAQRQQAQDIQERLEQAQKVKTRTLDLYADVNKQLQAAGTLYEASLFPGPGHLEAGFGAVFSGGPHYANAFALVEVVAPLDGVGPFSVSLVDEAGQTRQVGQLARSPDGTYFWQNLKLDQAVATQGGFDLAHVSSMAITDQTGTILLTGALHPSVQTPPSP
jgi:hypothetical protein